jgi:hypothetical protein
MDSLLEILEALWYTKPLFPKGSQMNGIDGILEQKIRALNPFLETHSDSNPSPAVSENPSKPAKNNCRLEVLHRLVNEFLESANKALGDETIDYYGLKVIIKQGERVGANIAMCRVESNSVGGDASRLLELEDIQSSVDQQVVNLERSAADKERINAQKLEIQKVKISSSRTKIEKFTGGSPDLFLSWVDQMTESFNSRLYKDPKERCMKLKCFLDLNSS